MAMSHAERRIRYWLRRAGFGHYHLSIVAASRDELEGAWALVEWDLDEEAVEFALPPEGTLPDDLMELVIIHEVAHGICALAQAQPGGTLEEVACNRILRLVKPRAVLPNEWNRRMGSDNVARLGVSREVGLAIDTLPFLTDEDRFILNARLYERRTFDDIARELEWWSPGGRPDHKKVKRRSERLTYIVGRAVQEAMKDG